MIKKLGRYLAVIALVVGGTTVVTASPALAVGGCDQTNQAVGACIDHGSYGSNARADFYFNWTPNNYYYYYSVWIQVNGTWHQKVNQARLTRSGNWCCWYQAVASLPASYKTIRSRVTIYTASGALQTTSTSPAFTIYA
ncbi:hypothetical protein O7632_08820 [Solwaraspora sp. WMMD406]|uniref:hypothetical protein n=1 Tax=Solwaraspora sp. WMMD406 TaxID=3016095 RepID=UPI002417E179|nr:hypothetical protein [Solwaraspora sp. WMMD406]MDG4764205.1 hypothetical protein [Solwaraspora sp. WMMD406]